MRKICVLALVVSVQACGGSDGPKAAPGMVDATQARSTVGNAVSLRASVETMNGPSVAGAALAFNGSTSNIVTETEGAIQALVSGPAALEMVMQAQSTSGSQACSATRCTFDKYTVDGDTTLDGTVDFAPSGDGKNIKWSLTMTGGEETFLPDFSYTSTGQGNITISATSLTGEVTTTASGTGSVQGQSFSTHSESYVRFDMLVLSAGNATGGSLYARTTTTGSAGGQGVSEAYEGTHQFGP